MEMKASWLNITSKIDNNTTCTIKDIFLFDLGTVFQSVLTLSKSWDNIFVLLCRSSDQESYSVEFVFDADVKCAVTVHYRATEDLSTGLAMWVLYYSILRHRYSVTRQWFDFVIVLNNPVTWQMTETYHMHVQGFQ